MRLSQNHTEVIRNQMMMMNVLLGMIAWASVKIPLIQVPICCILCRTELIYIPVSSQNSKVLEDTHHDDATVFMLGSY